LVALLQARARRPVERAPARDWPPAHRSLAYLDYYTSNRMVRSACQELRLLTQSGVLSSLPGGYMVMRALAGRLASRLRTLAARG
jgi:hypothetical protein